MTGNRKLLAAALCWLVVVSTTTGQSGLVRHAVDEVIELIMRSGAKSGARELTEIGGEAAIRQLIERVAREGGEESVARLTRVVRISGADGVRAVSNAPASAPVLRALSELPEELVPRATRALSRGADGRILAGAIERTGRSAIDAELRHPGLGARLVSVLGEDGARLAASIQTRRAVVLARHADEIAALPAAQRGELLTMLQRSPAQILGFLERHPRITLTVGVAAVLIANKEAIFGGAELVLDENGNLRVLSAPGWLDRTRDSLIENLLVPILSVVLPVAMLVGAVWVTLKMGLIRRLLRTQSS